MSEAFDDDDELGEAEERFDIGEVPEKTVADRAKEVGRDGAYLELDASGLVAAYKSGELQRAKIVVVKAARIELSDEGDVAALIQTVGQTVNCLEHPSDVSEVTGMSNEQASFYALRRILSNGLRG